MDLIFELIPSEDPRFQCRGCVKDYQANESKINDIIGKDSISYSFLSIWNKIY